MEQANPYQAPSADVATAADFGEYDESSPFSRNGRFGRLSYLAWTAMFGFAIYVVVAALAALGGLNQLAHASHGEFFVLQLLSWIIVVRFVVRRLHDFDASGWWSLLLLVPFVNFIFGLVLAIKAGTEGANNFGPPRLTRGWEKVVAYISIGVVPAIMVIGILAAIIIPVMTHPH